MPYKPDGYTDLSPYMLVSDAEAVMRFAEAALDASRLRIHRRPDHSIQHAELQIGDSVLMMGEVQVTKPVQLHLYLPDPDAAHARALEAGGTLIQEMHESGDGDRRGGVADPLGNGWWFAAEVNGKD